MNVNLRSGTVILFFVSLFSLSCWGQTKISLPDGKYVKRYPNNVFEFYNASDKLLAKDAFPGADPNSVIIQRSGKNPPFSFFAIQVGATIRAYSLSNDAVYRSATWKNNAGNTQISIQWNESAITADISSSGTYGQFQFIVSATNCTWGVIFRPPGSSVEGISTTLSLTTISTITKSKLSSKKTKH